MILNFVFIVLCWYIKISCLFKYILIILLYNNFCILFLVPTPVEDVKVPTNPCIPSPCGPNSQCQVSGNEASCLCFPNYVGSPPNCRPECIINPDCSTNQACINNKCTDPCTGTCGLNAQCAVISHAVTCTCIQGYTGNAFIQCLEQKRELFKVNSN